MTAYHDFGPAFLIDAEAIGEPGNRTFHIVVSSGHEVASLWLEKEQLQAVGLAIRRQLASQRRSAPASDPNDVPTLENTPLPPPTIDFHVGQLALGFDPDRETFIIQADEVASQSQDQYTFSCQITREQARALAGRIEAVVSAGRPLCPLCNAPINPGERHVCPRANGHVNEHPV
jgi:uncharacterized repeat protein (TIGR03847 family)